MLNNKERRVCFITEYILILTSFALFKYSVFPQTEKPRIPFLNKLYLCGGLGGNILMGDLGGGRGKGNRSPEHLDIQAIRADALLGARYKVNPWFSTKLFLDGGIMGGSDRYTRNVERRLRGLRTLVPFMSLVGQAELYFIPDRTIDTQNLRGQILPAPLRTWSMYFFLGFSGLFSWPRVTSLSGFNFSGPTGTVAKVVFPLGLGADFFLTERWSVSAEGGYTFSLSDYLDGVNLDSKRKDGLLYTRVIVNFRLNNKKNPTTGVNCPNFVRGKTPTEKSQEGKRLKFGKEYSKKKGNLNVREYGQ